ncbi:hypothetical protein NDU88_001884 [Pleurodeles waltl]|uniref:Uncharacterized protein n=1 Tax=Pleurodeles waltl TaxID=8319 RepID=A0AAV7VBF9_PLEWA|nr:hypothetical protein NDU88_001884 [Pleurodeles waltl]
MSDRLDKHAECLDQVERIVSEAEEEHNTLTTVQKKVAQNEVMHMGNYAVATVYGEGDRAGSTLATLLCPNRENNVILEIQDDTGRVWIDAKSVTRKFCDYYMDLYKSCLDFDEAAVTDYLTHLAVSWLTA